MRYVVVALLLISALSGAAIAQESPDIAGATTTFDVELRENGAADWTVESTVSLDTAEERDAFTSYADRYEDGEVSAGPGIEFFEAAADAASTTSDREMAIRNVERDATVGDDEGTLRLQFRWTQFLAAEGDSFELRDALLTEDGTWLRSLEAGQELRIRTPPGHEIQRSIEARQENDSLVVTGPESFDPEEFSVVYAPEDNGGSPNGGPENGFDALAAALLGLLFVVVLVLAVWRWRGGEPIAATGGDDAPPPDEAAVGPSEKEPDAESGVDPELLSDEERVHALLEENGGRMRQADIVTETDWSDAKVSQLLSRMADEGSVEKLRLGRENVISLPNDEDGNGQ